MTRAEKAALEAYPPKFTTPKRRARRIQSGKVDTHAPVRAIFRKAYEQGQKETIERAIEWLKEHAEDYIVNMTPSYPDAPFDAIIGGNCWVDLKQAMEE